MNIKHFSSEEWLSKAENSGITVHRCIYWKHKEFSFNKYRYMKNHLLIFVDEGKLFAELDKKIISLNAGDVLWILPGTLRRTYIDITSVQEKDYRLHFNIGNGETEFRFTENTPVIRKAWELLPLFQMLSEVYQNPLKYNRQFSQGICQALVSEYLSLYELDPQKAFSNKQVNQLYSFIINNADRSIAPSELASIVKLSPDYFSRKFRNYFGISPKKFIKQEKIRFIAGFLLESDLSVKETAFRFGYEDGSYFCRQFKEVMKCSPMTHRKKNI